MNLVNRSPVLSVNGKQPDSPPSSPAQKIAEIIAEMGVEQYQFADIVGMSPAYLSMVIQGKRRLTDGLITHLAKATSIAESDWKQLRDKHEIWEAQHPSSSRSFRTSSGGVLSRQDIQRAVKDGALIVEPFMPENLSHASLELTLGESQRLASWNDIGSDDASLSAREERDHLVIKPGECWQMWTKEKLKMPNNLCGRIAACGELIAHGIIVGFGLQVDPMWNGHPFLSLMHCGREPFELSDSEPFVSLELRTLCTPCIPPNKHTSNRP